MTMRIILKTMLSCCMTAGALMIVSCTDSKYDLSNLDKRIAIGSEQEFILPGNNSTHNIVLDDVIDLKDNDVIKVDDAGNYYFSRGADESEVDAAHPVVEEIPLVKIDEGNDTDVDVSDFIIEDDGEARVLLARRAAGEIAFSSAAKEIYKFNFSADETSNVVDMLMAKLRAGLNVTLTFTEELKAKLENIKVLRLGLPAFFNLDIELSTDYTFDKATNSVEIKKLDAEGVTLRANLHGINFNQYTPEAPDMHGYYLSFDKETGAVQLNGGVILDLEYEAPATARSQAKAGINENLLIMCHSLIDEVTLTGAEGRFSPEIDLGSIGTFNVGDLPDFLDDEEVTLNISNPEIRLGISSNADLQGKIIDARIIAYDENNKELATVEINDFMINPHKGSFDESTKTNIVISDGKQSTNGGVICIKPKEGNKLANLLHKLPKSVSFECKAIADTAYAGTIDMGVPYTIQPSYEVYAPLSFDANSIVVYRDSITGWHEDLEDITLSKDSYVILTADVTNKLPVDLKFSAEAIDEKGNRLDNRLIDVNVTNADGSECNIAAGTDSAPGLTSIKIVLKQNDSSAFSIIDGIAFLAKAITPSDGRFDGVPLNNQKQTLKIDNIGIILKGRVIVDLDD